MIQATDVQPCATASSPLFVEHAEDIVARLLLDPSPGAVGLLAEARALAEVFRRWEIEKPPNEARVRAIQTLMELNRRAREHLSSRGTSIPPVETPADGSGITHFFRRLVEH